MRSRSQASKAFQAGLSRPSDGIVTKDGRFLRLGRCGSAQPAVIVQSTLRNTPAARMGISSAGAAILPTWMISISTQSRDIVRRKTQALQHRYQRKTLSNPASVYTHTERSTKRKE